MKQPSKVQCRKSLTHMLEKAGKKEFEGVVSAAYVDRTVTQVFKDEK